MWPAPEHSSIVLKTRSTNPLAAALMLARAGPGLEGRRNCICPHAPAPSARSGQARRFGHCTARVPPVRQAHDRNRRIVPRPDPATLQSALGRRWGLEPRRATETSARHGNSVRLASPRVAAPVSGYSGGHGGSYLTRLETWADADVLMISLERGCRIVPRLIVIGAVNRVRYTTG